MKIFFILFILAIFLSCKPNTKSDNNGVLQQNQMIDSSALVKDKIPVNSIVNPPIEKEVKYKVCTECRGTGQLNCTECNGTGHIEHVCRNFNILGVESCKSCEGYGQISNGNVIVKCSICNGRGTRCYYCKNKGEGNGIACNKCSGYGYSICDFCDGKGEVEDLH